MYCGIDANLLIGMLVWENAGGEVLVQGNISGNQHVRKKMHVMWPHARV